jgi:hypothetical protein
METPGTKALATDIALAAVIVVLTGGPAVSSAPTRRPAPDLDRHLTALCQAGTFEQRQYDLEQPDQRQQDLERPNSQRIDGAGDDQRQYDLEQPDQQQQDLERPRYDYD